MAPFRGADRGDVVLATVGAGRPGRSTIGTAPAGSTPTSARDDLAERIAHEEPQVDRKEHNNSGEGWRASSRGRTGWSGPGWTTWPLAERSTGPPVRAAGKGDLALDQPGSRAS